MSAQIYAISDLHFGHKAIAEKRGFINVEDHDKYIVYMWNSIVHKHDTVYILGDITMEKDNYSILDQLIGYKKVILGNHDAPQHVKSLLKHVNSVCGAFKYKDCILTHIPIHPSEFHRFKYNVHGHTHDVCIDEPRYINVSIENQEYIPFNLSNLGE
jgi:calcineurin-like phosphoesterase family protein